MRFSASLSAGSAVTLWIASALSGGCSSPTQADPVTAGSGGLAGSAGASGASGNAGSAGSGASAGASGSGGSSGAGSSGAGGVAGAGQAGSAGASGGTPAALCPEGTLFCDDFEEGALGQAPGSPWAASTNGGTVAVDGTRAFSGTKSVLATAPTGASYRRAYIGLDAASGIFPAAATGMYGRAMFWLEAAPTEVHWTMIQAEGPTTTPAPPHAAQYRYGGQHDTGRLMANYETNSGVATDCYAHAQTTVIPTGRWACFEWHFVVATNEMQLWLDGTDVAGLHVVDRGEGCAGQATAGQWQAPPAFTNLYLGWEHYQAWSSDIRMWVDGVAVSTERVGCPAP